MKKEVEKGNRKKSLFKLIFLIYSFIFSIEVIKRASLFLAPNIKNFFWKV